MSPVYGVNNLQCQAKPLGSNSQESFLYDVFTFRNGGAQVKLFSQTPKLFDQLFQRPQIISRPISAPGIFQLNISFGGDINSTKSRLP